jgi:GNAT superfamily N-acetyltransferase
MPSNILDRTRLERVVKELPASFEVLRAEARAEGYRHIDRLAIEWRTGVMRFDREGEALLAALLDADLAGVGGLTIDPTHPSALRMRRFYVRKSFRRNGIGRAIAENLLAPAHASGLLVTVNAGGGSEPFWESLGFVSDPRNGHTHVCAIGLSSATPDDRGEHGAPA